MTAIVEDMFFGAPFGGLIPLAQGAVLATLLRTSTPLTGRQVHALVSDDYSLWSVQEALKKLTQLGLVNSRTVGRAGVHTVNEDHVAVAPLRALVDPIAALTATLRESIDDDVEIVILFGSVARGEAKISSDIDLAVIAADGWRGRPDLQDAVRIRLGNNCDVLVFTHEEFTLLTRSREPVVRAILTDGIALIGSMSQLVHQVA